MDDENDIQAYWHCRKCIEEKPEGISPAEWQRTSVGFTSLGDVQAWCNRHDIQITRVYIGAMIEAAKAGQKH